MVEKSLSKKQTRTQSVAETGAARFAAIEARLSEIESRLPVADLSAETVPGRKSSTFATGKPRKFWALEHIQQHGPDNGVTMFAGQVTLPSDETYAWQVESALDDLLAADWLTAHPRMAALAHPVRLTILKALLVGQRDTQSLQALPDMGTTGQLYHHLKELESAGWIRQPRRGEYIVLAERVIPLLAILSACEVR
jgi:hypothetical protein